MNSSDIHFISDEISSLYHLQASAVGKQDNMVALVLRAVQSDISKNTAVANTILLKYISDPCIFSVDDLKGLREILKLAIMAALDDYPDVALSYSEAAADCVLQIKKRLLKYDSAGVKQASLACC